MPKISIKNRLESYFHEKIEDILEDHFKGIQTEPEAVKKLNDITKGTITTSSITIQKMIYDAKLDLENFPFAKFEKKEGLHRGGKSIK